MVLLRSYSYDIMRGVRLKCVSTRKFKTGAVSVSLVCPLDKKTAAMNAVLPYVLRRGTASHPDMLSIEAYLDELYGARLEPVLRKRGEAQCIGFYADFIDEAFAEKDVRIIEKTVDLMAEMLLMPAVSGGRLRRDYVETEKDNLIADIKAELNDRRSYASGKLIEKMCDKERYSVPKLGRLKEAEKITVATLTKHYRELLPKASIEIFYCGSADPDRVARAVKTGFRSLPRGEIAPFTANEIIYSPRGPVREFSEELDLTQSRLAMGYRVGEAMRRPNQAALMTANAMLGGVPTSRLFMNVREKQSLCYYVSSGLDRHKGVLLISSGVDEEKLGAAREEIERQIALLKNGEFEDWELEAAKKSIVTAYLSVCDSQPALESVYLDFGLSGLDIAPEDVAALAEEVSREDVLEVFRGIELDAVFTLKKGGSEDVH
ncbi:MAG: insulinase family protein [Oscillospiraceae bacterium]|nr:insulinase family protein [Oscillospiraceae bacterium]